MDALNMFLTALVAIFTGLTWHHQRRKELSPAIDIYLDLLSHTPGVVDLVVRNSGRGVAYDVRVRLSHAPGKGSSENASRVLETMNDKGFVSHGLSVLPPGIERRSRVFYLPEILGKEDPSPVYEVQIDARATCRDVGYRRHKFRLTISMQEFRGVAIATSPMDKFISEVPKTLDKIAKSLKAG